MPVPPSDLELLAQWREGDNRAGSALVKRHFDALHRFFGNKAPAQSEDLIQQTFAACVETKDAFRGDSSFRTYLFGVARLQLYAHYRKAYRKDRLDFTTTSVRDLGTSPTGHLARREEQLLLQQALQNVPVDQQIALELTYWEGMAAPEIARVLGVPENTVYSRLRRAREHLRRALVQLSQAPDEAERALALLAPGAEE